MNQTNKRAARKDVEAAFAPIAVKRKLNFKPNEETDYTKHNQTFLVGLKGGKFSAMTVLADGSMKPVFPGLAPRNAAQLVDILTALDSILEN